MKDIKFSHSTSKIKSLADGISLSIMQGNLKAGDNLPSINEASALHKVSRDTVFKAYNELKRRGLIDSTPTKGYFVTGEVNHVLLLLDTYSSFKQNLYHRFAVNLPENFKVDLIFHQYNEHLFETIVRESIGKYSMYVVMNFSNDQFSDTLKTIPANKLLLLDFGNFEKSDFSYICQDFDDSFYLALFTLKERMQKYLQIVFLFSKGLKHPQSSKEYFTRFCEKEGFLHEIQEDIENLTVRKGTVYIAIKQQDVVKVVKQGRLAGLKCGKDFGLLAYNDIPSYEVIDEGITSLSIDWEMMGNEAANFVLNNVPVQKFLPTEVRLRKSL